MNAAGPDLGGPGAASESSEESSSGNSRCECDQCSERERYEKAVALFLTFLYNVWQCEVQTSGQLDVAVSAYLEALWQEGEGRTMGNYILAAIHWFMPEVKRKLVSSWRLLRAWDKLELPARATPASPGLLLAVCELLARETHERLAFMLVIAFSLFLRTSEILAFKRGDVEFGAEEAVMTLKVSKGISKRSYASVERLVVRDPLALVCLRRLCEGLEPGDALVMMSVAEFRRLWAKCIKRLGLEGENYLPYAIRRGGATLFFRQTNNLPLTMLVGRWAHMRTARIYLEDGLMVLAGTRFSPAVKSLLAAGAREFLKRVGVKRPSAR